MGIGTRRDPLDANAWYVKAADQGDERAKQRVAAIRAAASGEMEEPPPDSPAKRKMKKGEANKVAPASQNEKKAENAKDAAVAKDGEETKERSKKKWGIF